MSAYGNPQTRWFVLVERLGISSVLVAIGVWMFFRACEWTAPRIEKVVDAQIDSMHRQSVAIESIGKSTDSIKEAIVRTESVNDRIHDTVRETAVEVRALRSEISVRPASVDRPKLPTSTNGGR